jgi:phosphoesterase RecJ-like protein
MPDEMHGNLWERMEAAHTLLITTHVRPDGDGIASELALKSVLSSLGKDVVIVNQDPVPDMYAWLPGAEEIRVYREGIVRELGPLDCGVLLDCSSEARIGRVVELLRRVGSVLCIDHHVNTHCPGDAHLIDPAASSIGEMLFRVIPGLESRLSPDVAVCLYTSILTDTGSFTNANTRAGVFGIAGKLVKAGADPALIHRRIYRNKRLVYFRLLSRALDRLRIIEGGKIAYTLLPERTYREVGATDDDTEGILDVMKALRGVQLIVMIRQVNAGEVKISLRSTDSVDCSEIARIFGGGGHARASGFSVSGTVEEESGGIIDRLVDILKGRGWL